MLNSDIEREAEYESSTYRSSLAVSKLRLKWSRLTLRFPTTGMDEENSWKGNEQAKRLQEQDHLHSLKAAIYQKQASRVDVGAGDEANKPRGSHATLDHNHQGIGNNWHRDHTRPLTSNC